MSAEPLGVKKACEAGPLPFPPKKGFTWGGLRANNPPLYYGDGSYHSLLPLSRLGALDPHCASYVITTNLYDWTSTQRSGFKR